MVFRVSTTFSILAMAMALAVTGLGSIIPSSYALTMLMR